MLYEAKTDAPYKFITADSRECNGECAFVVDWYSEKFTADAIERGVTHILRAADLKTQFDTQIPVIGITGTKGKTTVAALIYSILLDLGYKAAMQGTRGFFINNRKVAPKHLTTPMLLDNYARLEQAINEGCDFFITEVSSHAIAQGRLEGIDFALKIHTNITADHFDFHHTFEEYRRVKNSFFADQTLKLINKDDPNVEFNYANARTYAIESSATFKLAAYSQNRSLSGVIAHGDENALFNAELIGKFNLYNIVAAVAAVKLITDKPLETICECVENFGGVCGRMEIVSQKPLVIVDFAHTPDSIAQALAALEPQKCVVVFGAGGDRDKTKRPLMGKAAAHGAVRLFITNDNPRNEDPLVIIEEIRAGCANHPDLHIEPDRTTAIRSALASLAGDEILVILGKGDEETQTIGAAVLPYSDKQTVLTLLKELECCEK